MAVKDKTKIVMMGPCNVVVAGVNVGHTGASGAKVAGSTTFVEAMVGQYGQSVVDVFENGQRFEVEFSLAQTEFATLAACLPGATQFVDGADRKLGFGKTAGQKVTAVTFKLTALNAANTPLYDFTAMAVPIGDFEIPYSGEATNEWTCKFLCVVDETAAEGRWLAEVGDVSITADVAAPTMSAILPLDDEAAASRATTIVATFSENLDPTTVHADSFFVLEDPLGAGETVKVAGAAPVLVNNGASTTITFTPGSTLSALTAFAVVITGAIKDLAGNAFVQRQTNFTTVA